VASVKILISNPRRGDSANAVLREVEGFPEAVWWGDAVLTSHVAAET
jgi:hypothetical protein